MMIKSMTICVLPQLCHNQWKRRDKLFDVTLVASFLQLGQRQLTGSADLFEATALQGSTSLAHLLCKQLDHEANTGVLAYVDQPYSGIFSNNTW